MNASRRSRRSCVRSSKAKSMQHNLPYGRATAYLPTSTSSVAAPPGVVEPSETRDSPRSRAVNPGVHHPRWGSAGEAEDVDVAGGVDRGIGAGRVQARDEGGDVLDR